MFVLKTLKTGIRKNIVFPYPVRLISALFFDENSNWGASLAVDSCCPPKKPILWPYIMLNVKFESAKAHKLQLSNKCALDYTPIEMDVESIS